MAKPIQISINIPDNEEIELKLLDHSGVARTLRFTEQAIE